MIKRYKNVKVRRKMRVRSRIKGAARRPRLSVFRSNKAIYAQLINDEKGETLMVVTDQGLKGKTKVEKAKEVGSLLAQKALKKGIKTVIFDRGSYRYHGRIKALAEEARKSGLKF
jgi:large subunit ribosomal protein L18